MQSDTRQMFVLEIRQSKAMSLNDATCCKGICKEEIHVQECCCCTSSTDRMLIVSSLKAHKALKRLLRGCKPGSAVVDQHGSAVMMRPRMRKTWLSSGDESRDEKNLAQQ